MRSGFEETSNEFEVSNSFTTDDSLDYDPFDEDDLLVDFDSDDDEFDVSAGQMGPRVDEQAQNLYSPAPDNRSAEERTAALFESLAPRRRVLLGILSFLETPKRSDALQEKVEELQTYDRSVYSGYDFSQLLFEAGAITKVSEDGSAFDENAEQAPDIVEIDGVKFYKPTDGKQVFWLLTDAGRAYLAADDPLGRLEELANSDSYYASVYKDVLEFCSNEAGRSVIELDALVNKSPLVHKPRKHCSYFIHKLEGCGALLWSGTWKTTDIGTRGKALFEVADENEGDAQ